MKEKLKEIILTTTDGLVGSLVDFTLFLTYFGLEFGTTLGNKREATYKGIKFANETLEKINYRSIKRTLYDLKRKGFLSYLNRELITAEKITAEGLKRIESIMPIYNPKRTWDKRIYLITYDIPSTPQGKRDDLREFLKQLGCGLLQQSVWLTCYNPKKLIQNFVEENNIPGQILISDLGTDGSIGNKDIKTLMEEIYKLEAINEDYRIFIKKFSQSDKNNPVLRSQAAFAFLSILQKDPQLPWSLLPDKWVGKKAHSLYQKFLP